MPSRNQPFILQIIISARPVESVLIKWHVANVVMRAAGQTSRDEDRAAVNWTTTRMYFRIRGFVILRRI